MTLIVIGLATIAVAAIAWPHMARNTDSGQAIGRALRIAASAGLAAILLFAGVVLIGFYYFWANTAIPELVDRVQVTMLGLAAVAAATAVVMLARTLYLVLRS